MDESKSKKAEAEVEQLRVQLAGCGAAACGATDPDLVAKPGDYGWTASYEDTLRLRRRFDRLYEALVSFSSDHILPHPLAEVLREIRLDMRGEFSVSRKSVLDEHSDGKNE